MYYELTAEHLVRSYDDNCHDYMDDKLDLYVPGGLPTFGCEHVGSTQSKINFFNE